MGSTEFQERQDILQSLILRLHRGEDWDAVQADFKKHFTGVSAYEISVMEQGLMGKGIDAEDIQRLCNVHASLFGGSIEAVYTTSAEQQHAGHRAGLLGGRHRDHERAHRVPHEDDGGARGVRELQDVVGVLGDPVRLPQAARVRTFFEGQGFLVGGVS